MITFSCFGRSKILTNLQQQSYDLLVIGGGITGAGHCAGCFFPETEDRASRKSDFSFGTSNRSASSFMADCVISSNSNSDW